MKGQILVIEDNKMMRSFLTHLFGKKNEVIAKSSAEDALIWLNDGHSPEVIISDYQLEGMSGFELLERLQSSGFYKDIPFVMLSGKSKSDNRIKCLEAGAADFIIKPFNPVELELKIHKLLQTKLSQINQRA